ncbi:DoxX family protein [Nocardia sp. CDC160]|uniref:DoxX family protein n=1 Tax=Nocardia sp. CDC160 TaxID=3112166 RepID=UPI002DB88A3C|nr:DoxX family protein [Nocardia sp. CDC160]MEC3915154.1 DoxX family protein [Nocardia sp. CDC160]
MTDKPTEPSAAAGDATPDTPRPAGSPVRSPFDSPTEQFPTPVGVQTTEELTTEKIETTAKLPRTDEELGLDPEVPLYSQVKNAIPGVANSTTAEPSPTYSFASIPPAPAAPADGNGRPRRRDERRGTLDLGLLLLRLVIGGTFVYHGLQKATGWFHGPGLDGIKTAMESGGWKHVDIAAPMLIAGELGGGVLVAIGLATPLAAGALLAVILDAWMWKQGMNPGFQYSAKGNSVELESILVGLTTVLILTGPGRLSLDRNRGWSSRPFMGSLAAFVAAVVAAILTYVYLHGGNPLTGIGPFD